MKTWFQKKRWVPTCIGLAFCSLLLLLAQFKPVSLITAQSCEEISCSSDSLSEDEYLSCIKEKQGCWQTKISEAQSQAVTLNNTISVLNGQIALQELEIEQTQTEISLLEKEVVDLTSRISGLEVSLDRLTELLIKRVQEHYKQTRATKDDLLLLAQSSSGNAIGGALAQQEYLQRAQSQIGVAMERAETQRLTYDQQKALKEEKQAEVIAKSALLESQQAQLATQKGQQEVLLSETRSNEQRYQQELAKTQAELAAIQSIIAGRGDETEVGGVSQGETIASIIVGASACSTGTHLHFEVTKDGTHRNPAGYLKNISAVWNNSPDGAFDFTGDWEWPVSDPARINQGYGMTYYASVRRAYGGAPHTGIDLVSKSGTTAVKSVKNGTLYRGSIPCGGGLLKYVKVEHESDNISSYYLHVNY